MISIVTAYYNRKTLFERTLQSIANADYPFAFEFLAVDDGSEDSERLEDLESAYPFLRVIRIEKSQKWYMNPCIPFNKGISEAKGEKIILQNPECYHLDNILAHVEAYLREGVYLSFGCFSLDKKATDISGLRFQRDQIETLIRGANHVVKKDGGLGWYNHSRFRPEALHFCAAITRSDLLDLGGFDERFATGYGYDDNELIHRIRLKKMRIDFVDDVRVLHQNHYNPSSVFSEAENDKYERTEAKRNRLLYETVTKSTNEFRAGILYTHDGKFPIESRRRWYTIISNRFRALKQLLKP